MTETRRAGGVPKSRWWVAVITFAVGVVVGVIGVGLLRAGTPEFPSATGPTATLAPTTTSPSADGAVDASAEARINAACLRVINEAQEVYDIITGVGEAAADVDLQRLDDMVRQLQPIEPRLGSALQECRVDTSVGGSPGPASSPPVSPTPQATATPTG